MTDARAASGTTPVVSVVVPTCNRRAKLRRCLDSLAVQTYRAFEVIVVDDASTDDTASLIAESSRTRTDLPLQYLRNEKNLGANPSRNRGIAAARGQFVAFLDSDCVAERDWLECLMRGFSSPRVAAVTGLVKDQPPTNIYELTFLGTHRIDQPGPAYRLIAGNMCVRRDVLLSVPLDEDRARQQPGAPDLEVSGRGDEEGLFLMMRASGLAVMTVPDAVVVHDHPYTRRSFFKQAFRGGGAAARLVYKYYLPPRIDIAPFVLMYLTLPLMAVQLRFGLVPLAFFAAACAALAGNELLRKRKSILDTLRIFPVQLAYYQVRVFGYVKEWARLTFTRNEIIRVRLSGVRLKLRA